MTKPPPTQPWAVLYNLESKLGPATLPAIRRVGREPAMIPRENKMIQLTADEKRTLEQTIGLLKAHFAPAKVSGGQIVGFAIRLLNYEVTQKGVLESTKDWPELWEKIAGNQGE
jgi:hypothetical protein